MAGSRTPTRSEVINRAIARGAAALHVCLPVEVVSYNAGDQTVCVQPLISDLYEDDNGVVQFDELGQINNAPVRFGAGGNFRITFPIQAGDTGELIVNDRSIDAWARYGGTQQPKDSRRHHLADGFYLGGVCPAGKWSQADPSVITIGDDTKPGDMVATANRVQAQLNLLAKAMSPPQWVPVPMDGGAALSASIAALIATGWPNAPASATVKILG